MSWPARALALLLALAMAFAAGWGVARRQALAQQTEDALAAERGARVIEAQETRRAARIADALTHDRLRSERAAADAAERLRQLAATAPDQPASGACRDPHAGPAAWLLRDADREDLVALARDADAVADRLRACQARLMPEAAP